MLKEIQVKLKRHGIESYISNGTLFIPDQNLSEDECDWIEDLLGDDFNITFNKNEFVVREEK